ncbi:MAG: putative sulfate exporter family transporter, partial [Bacteroidia bacterium]|nr:putative sulfate exporter family transporter [Bacteroidia bacterium]NNJ54862.1 putative sulfate exporter family transporter [Bacteroidia bacterium]
MYKDLIKPHIWGLVLTSILAALAMYLSNVINFNDVLLALLFGIVIGNLVKLPKTTSKGIKTSSGLFLELAIVLMAFNINYLSFISLGWQTILIIVVSMAIILVSTVFLAKRMNCPGSTGWLVGFGTAICGSSAIAALAPSVTKDKTDMGIALAVVNLFGLIGMVAIPFITSEIFSDMQNAVLIGTSLHSVGNVAGAGFGISDSVGEMAVTVKLGRVALLTPALLIFRSFVGPKKNMDAKEAKFNLPWYLIAFIVIS